MEGEGVVAYNRRWTYVEEERRRCEERVSSRLVMRVLSLGFVTEWKVRDEYPAMNKTRDLTALVVSSF